jgi:hypothetical protein
MTTGFTLAQNNDLALYFSKVDAFLHKNVKNGLVDYEGIKKNPSELREIKSISNTLSISESDVANYKAFWINNYNIAVIELLVENYPISSPKAVPGFFDAIKVEYGQKKITLSHLENKMLRKIHPDARYHFTLVCGALSCPPLASYAYMPQLLDKQLDVQTTLAMDNSEFLKVDLANGKVEISEIFRWYREDFIKEKGSFVDYINSYKTTKLPKGVKTSFYTYNWIINELKTDNAPSNEISNIRAFTPSKLLSKGKFDFKLFNNLYTQNRQTDEGSKPRDLMYRNSFMTTTLEVSYGISKNARINVGAVIGYRNAINSDGGVLDVFHYQNEMLDTTGTTYKRSAFNMFMPVIKISPFKSLSNFSFQTGVSIPLFGDEGYGYLDKRSYVWDTRFFFDHSFADNKFQVFTELDAVVNFGEKGGNELFANNSLYLPGSVFLSYFPNDKITVYANAQQAFLVDLGNDFSQEFTQIGLGMKFQATKALNIEVSHGQFVRGSNYAGLGQAYNLGLRYIL